jgi:peptide-methionine (S)-S-oxide reductase
MILGRRLSILLATLVASIPLSLGAETNTPAARMKTDTNALELATFAGGCFWCLEAVFERLDGVKSVVSGYAGGKTDKPTYKAVCEGDSGHAEVVQIAFDPKVVSFSRLLDVFWEAHDPTTLNRQGADHGTQYRSAIFFHSPEQQAAAEGSKRAADSSGKFRSPIVTELAPLTRFWPAEEYHQDYFRRNPTAGYCRIVIDPKLDKLRLKRVLPDR